MIKKSTGTVKSVSER